MQRAPPDRANWPRSDGSHKMVDDQQQVMFENLERSWSPSDSNASQEHA
jgi:hypothetical protein